MKTKTMKQSASGSATGGGAKKRGGVKPRAATSAHQGAASRTDARVGRKLKRAKARAPLAKLWQLRLYVMDQTSKSVAAFANLKAFCETNLKGGYHIKVIDLLKHPQLARGDQILAIPTVVRRLPSPVRTIIGSLSDTARLLVGLDLRATD